MHSAVRETLLFLVAGVLEIGGGYGVWVFVKNEDYASYRHILFAVLGSIALVAYGWVQSLQAIEFGRLFAVYGGYFIVLSLLWGWTVDGKKPDVGDWVGSLIAFAGVLVMLYWPRPATP
ncbi:hypothetical protein DYB25_005222 [Aphanomyces astaci]|uniref:Uncharacterized protein n=1 Tax=Aphanomyces astaci TaxID=112090 RepID=A0A397CAB2_APHAT|nr:hypothetical protein DYB25_005222 [Aphanomyces astaci]RHY39600.1 hypothetical protein DYB30_013502 [Aphanomyces astaci]RHY49292.1 hypothetical protein DYB34_003222 [Aphanomyces astaci]RHY62630.1 hypothetical protein DYB38_012803 [Aphanomyces astaci]RHZ12794.1 hypothetical protein DYB31_001032 [Aphanomyces astaci]